MGQLLSHKKKKKSKFRISEPMNFKHEMHVDHDTFVRDYGQQRELELIWEQTVKESELENKNSNEVTATVIETTPLISDVTLNPSLAEGNKATEERSNSEQKLEPIILVGDEINFEDPSQVELESETPELPETTINSSDQTKIESEIPNVTSGSETNDDNSEESLNLSEKDLIRELENIGHQEPVDTEDLESRSSKTSITENHKETPTEQFVTNVTQDLEQSQNYASTSTANDNEPISS